MKICNIDIILWGQTIGNVFFVETEEQQMQYQTNYVLDYFHSIYLNEWVFQFSPILGFELS